ncbi:hypothetical protein ACFV0R_19065 [Streptomyces sp. NPDC059578]|uniref:hypothetical protein n=1 Tax=Streptomyces sp. NPDC059578 TaxID=3346874 RepID=UPI0036C802D4
MAPAHKMLTISGVRVRAEDEARYRARHTATGPLGIRHANPPSADDEGEGGSSEDTVRETPGQPDGAAAAMAEAGPVAGAGLVAGVTPGTPPSPVPFDPADHTVPEVLDRLAAADAAETARVLGAEAAGRARTTILGKDTNGS